MFTASRRAVREGIAHLDIEVLMKTEAARASHASTLKSLGLAWMKGTYSDWGFKSNQELRLFLHDEGAKTWITHEGFHYCDLSAILESYITNVIEISDGSGEDLELEDIDEDQLDLNIPLVSLPVTQ